MIPHNAFAIPKTIAKIVQTFEGKHKKKKANPKAKLNKANDKCKDALPIDTSASPTGDAEEAPVVVPEQVSEEAPKNEPASVSSEASSSANAVEGTPNAVEGTPNAVEGAPNAVEDAPQNEPTKAEQARLGIDKAIKDRKLVKHPATWYYRGVIYDQLLREQITSQAAPDLLNEALAAYEEAKKLSVLSSQFHSFALGNIAALWNYYLEKGIAYSLQESFDQAVDHFAVCRRIIPEEPTPLLYTAIVYHNNDKPEEALRYYSDYLQDKGSVQNKEAYPAVFRAMADIQYNKLKKFDEAITLLDTTLVTFPLHNELLEEKLLIYKDANKIEEYEASLATVVSNKNKEVESCYAYAYFLENQGRIEEAISYYQQILKLKPNQHNTLRQMGLLFYNEAIKAYAIVQKLDGQIKQLGTGGGITEDLWSLIGVNVKQPFSYPLGTALTEKIVMYSVHPFFSSTTFVVHDGPLMQSSGIGNLRISDRIKADSLDDTSTLYRYIAKKIAVELLCYNRVQTIIELERFLAKSLHYLEMAYMQNKKDKTITQALYYNYFYLKKYGSAKRMLSIMQRQKQYVSQEDDPFFTEK
ncbi:tetratricopeptide repeat protein [Candidatus Cardinium hertigii]|uniref:tetratricopeptide repeat protein n=1 Tax=Candidatus Cardinium hertigii TaxID=247481 RepID=UPI00160A444D|nr:tetratricopeptide repeat protein [Candidatus Cardinium hertigii]